MSFTDTRAPRDTRAVNSGTQHLYRFPNGYGASVICHSFSYGGDDGLWELGVLGPDDRLTYETPITDDVIGRLAEHEVAALLDDIAALPAAVVGENSEHR